MVWTMIMLVLETAVAGVTVAYLIWIAKENRTEALSWKRKNDELNRNLDESHRENDRLMNLCKAARQELTAAEQELRKKRILCENYKSVGNGLIEAFRAIKNERDALKERLAETQAALSEALSEIAEIRGGAGDG